MNVSYKELKSYWVRSESKANRQRKRLDWD
jgi:hypothetical protein